ncbi:MAG: diguanylate cyclase [Pseudomonadota bacterium]
MSPAMPMEHPASPFPPHPASPVEIARAALHLLTEQGLPPTPENFSHHYHEVAGMPQPVTVAKFNEVFDSLRSLVDRVTNCTDSIASDVGQHNREIKARLNELAVAQEQKQMLTLLTTIVGTATSMYNEVEATHAELITTKGALEEIKAEIRESHDWLQRDPLTGTQNRRGMDAALAREVGRCRRNSSKLTVAMIDLDHFKEINDNYGHHAGDHVLVHVAEIAKSVLRDADILVRYGGEEFLLILPETDINGAKYVIDRLQIVMGKNPMSYEDKRINVSFSCGIAQLQESENGHALIMRADHALYEAKSCGRNCIKIASE